MQPIERQPRQPHMGELVIIVLAWIVRDGADGLRKHGRIPQFATSQIAAPCIFHDDAVGWIDDDPPSIHENLRNHMFGIAVGSQKEQAAHSQIGTSRKIQEGIRCSAADIQQLFIGERGLRIALGESIRIGCDRARWLSAHPIQNGFNLLFYRQGIRDNRIRESVEVPAHGIFPVAVVEHRHKVPAQTRSHTSASRREL